MVLRRRLASTPAAGFSMRLGVRLATWRGARLGVSRHGQA